jgi:hypothetical protein
MIFTYEVVGRAESPFTFGGLRLGDWFLFQGVPRIKISMHKAFGPALHDTCEWKEIPYDADTLIEPVSHTHLRVEKLSFPQEES